MEKVAKALTRIGGDSTLNAKDAAFRQTVTICTSWTMTLTSPSFLKSSTMVMTGNGMMRNGMMKLSSTPLKMKKEVPEELDQASQDVEDANVNYLDGRQKMRELALARGFYPVVALARHGQQQGWWQKQWQGF